MRMQSEFLLLCKRLSTAHFTACWLFLSLSMATTVVPGFSDVVMDLNRAISDQGRYHQSPPRPPPAYAVADRSSSPTKMVINGMNVPTKNFDLWWEMFY